MFINDKAILTKKQCIARFKFLPIVHSKLSMGGRQTEILDTIQTVKAIIAVAAAIYHSKLGQATVFFTSIVAKDDSLFHKKEFFRKSSWTIKTGSILRKNAQK